MRFRLSVCAFFVFLVPCKLFAQDRPSFEIGAFAGRPLNNVVQSNICCLASAFSSQQMDRTEYLLGLSAGVVLYDRLRLEFGATYMPISFRTTIARCCPLSNPTFATHGTAWEFPIIAAYRWMHGSIRPFSGGGWVIHNITSTTAAQSPAPLVAGGVEWVHGRLSFRPTFRYIHYPQYASSTNQAIGRPSNQSEVLLGASFRVH
jgi:hypothetical protein